MNYPVANGDLTLDLSPTRLPSLARLLNACALTLGAGMDNTLFGEALRVELDVTVLNRGSHGLYCENLARETCVAP